MNSDYFKTASAVLSACILLSSPQSFLFAQNSPQPIPASNYLDVAKGLGFEQLVQTALTRNADLLAARFRLTEAQGLLRQAGFRPNPGIDMSFGSGRLLGSAGEREVSVGYNHILEMGHKRELRVEVSEIGVQLAKFEIADRERRLRAEVRSRYADALAAIRNLEIADRQMQLNRETLRITEARVQQGEAPKLDQGLVQVEVRRIESDRLLFENQLQRALFAIKPLIGMNIEEPLALNGHLRGQTLQANVAELVSKALADRPDLQAVRVEASLREAETRAAKAEAVPNIIATGRYTRSNSSANQLGLTEAGAMVPIQNTDNILTAGVSITLPVKNRNQGLIQAAAARTDAARLRRQFAEQVVIQEVRASYSRYETAQRALALFDGQILNQAQDNLRIIQAAFSAGELRLFDVISEQRRLTDTQRAYTDVLREFYISEVELEQALGSPLR